MSLSRASIQEALALADNTWEGPWNVYVGFDRFSSDPGCYGAYLEMNTHSILVSALPDDTKNFIAASRELVPRLATELLKYMDAVDVAVKAIRKIDDVITCEALTRINEILETKEK